jgi:hypothetical protein
MDNASNILYQAPARNRNIELDANTNSEKGFKWFCGGT